MVLDYAVTDKTLFYLFGGYTNMMIELRERTAETVLTYFRATRDAEIQKFLPQKAQSEEEALADFEKIQ